MALNLYIHFKEAMAINKDRLEYYSLISGGKSLKVSQKLIQMERTGLIPALILDLLARPYQKKGIPVLQDEIMPMNQLPPFQEKAKESLWQAIDFFVPTNAKALNKDLLKAYQVNGFEGLSMEVEEKLKYYSEFPLYHSLVKHFLESILRTSNLAIRNKKVAKEKNLPSTEWISWAYVRFHLLGMKDASDIDSLAAPVQALGIPILLQDVPEIPSGKEFLELNTTDNELLVTELSLNSI